MICSNDKLNSTHIRQFSFANYRGIPVPGKTYPISLKAYNLAQQEVCQLKSTPMDHICLPNAVGYVTNCLFFSDVLESTDTTVSITREDTITCTFLDWMTCLF